MFVSQAEFAKLRGVSRKTVTIWKQKGQIVIAPDGRVDVVASEARLAERPATYRGGVVSHVEPPEPIDVIDDATADDGDELGDSNDGDLPLAAAVRRKENYLGLLRKHEFEVARGEWVRIEDVGLHVEREYATIRERLLSIPGKLAASLVGMDRVEIEAAIRREMSEALNELHAPDGLGGTGREAEAREAGASATA